MSARVAGGSDGLVQAIRARSDSGKEWIRRDTLQDGRLSLKARGLLGYLLSKPDEWRTNAQAIAGSCDKDGRDAVSAGLVELERFGYIARHRHHLSDGRWTWTWIYSDDPAEVAALVEEMTKEHGGESPQRGRARVKPQVEPITGKAGDGEQVAEKTQVEPINGFSVDGKPADGSAVDGKPVDIERRDKDLTPPPPAVRGELDPIEADKPAPCAEHGRRSCRPCGTSPRAQEWAARDAEKAAIADALRVKAECRMCDEYGWRHGFDDPVRCDHRSDPDDVRDRVAAERRAREDAKQPPPLDAIAQAKAMLGARKPTPQKRRKPGARSTTGSDKAGAA